MWSIGGGFWSPLVLRSYVVNCQFPLRSSYQQRVARAHFRESVLCTMVEEAAPMPAPGMTSGDVQRHSRISRESKQVVSCFVSLAHGLASHG